MQRSSELHFSMNAGTINARSDDSLREIPLSDASHPPPKLHTHYCHREVCRHLRRDLSRRQPRYAREHATLEIGREIVSEPLLFPSAADAEVDYFTSPNYELHPLNRREARLLRRDAVADA